MTDNQIESIAFMREQLAKEMERVDRVLTALESVPASAGIVKDLRELRDTLYHTNVGMYVLIPIINDLDPNYRPGRELIYCAHSLHTGTRTEKTRPYVTRIELGDNRQVMLCDLCTAVVEMDVVKSLIRELKPQLSALFGKWTEQ